ncbi:MAG: MBL fold metallo-hydrolase [Candidatus Pacearchaeota archaeon]|nr:MBL fold metallo-hydrolase [Candidatus Pacearchaeota archaeon]MDE1848962.1 MBL fold metallo-hydrolase [Nanoarchaeota archaeon]
MEVCTVGGYDEVGKNMTAVKIKDDVILFDAGVFLPALVEFQEREPEKSSSRTGIDMRRIGALPDDTVLDKIGWRDKVRAIIIGHAHLDHIGAVPYIASRYPKAKIIATPFTIEFLESMLRDEKITLRNQRIKVNENSTYVIKGKSGSYKAEFIHATHSTIQCAFICLYTDEGTLFYTLDFKFDDHPVIGKPSNYKRLGEIAKKGIDVLVADALYAGNERRTPSERIARDLVEDAINSVKDMNSALIISTFSSHIARLKSIVDFGKKTGRKIVFLGRSLDRYVNCAVKVRLCPFRRDVMILKYRKQINSFLSKANKDKGRYLIVCTGHQAEPGSVLDRIVKGETPFTLEEGDNVLFSSSVIPVDKNIKSREKMDNELKKKGVRIQTDLHVSGHGSREDLRNLIDLLKPTHLIPAHGGTDMTKPMIELASELGYKSGKTSHMSSNGKVLKL